MTRRTFARGLSACVATLLLACVAATGVGAQTPVYCVNGFTTTLPTALPFSNEGRLLTEFEAEFIIANSADHTTFYFGVDVLGRAVVLLASPGFDPGSVLFPGYTTNTVSRGPCAAGTPVGVAGKSFMCASGYGAVSHPDYVAGKDAIADYLAGDSGRRYAFFVQGDLSGPQRAQAAIGVTPAGSFYCRVPPGVMAEPIIGPDGKQMLADTQGVLYPSFLANGETIGHPAYRVRS